MNRNKAAAALWAMSMVCCLAATLTGNNGYLYAAAFLAGSFLVTVWS